MTACKDSQATSGKKAVSATLAGVPAVALADEAAEVTEEDGIAERKGHRTMGRLCLNRLICASWITQCRNSGVQFPNLTLQSAGAIIDLGRRRHVHP